MLIGKPNSIKGSEITPEHIYLRRREFIAGAVAAGLIPALPAPGFAAAKLQPLDAKKSKYSTDEKLTPYEDVTTYNNFYEFGTKKSDPAQNAHTLTTKPWSIKIDGLVNKPGTYDLEDILKQVTLEERIYRLRCVEAWSMVIPWIGFPLADLLKRVDPQGSAKYVAFETLVRPTEMPYQRGVFQPLEWPYREGLRIDEAMHPLTILAVGLFGKTMPNQNGAPVRLVVPWKYGFKSIKSIVRIKLMEKQPPTSWSLQASNEYGFFSNVNPNVSHPRWSQATERRIGEGGLFVKRRKTLMFNGYADEVASLYSSQDLKEDY